MVDLAGSQAAATGRPSGVRWWQVLSWQFYDFADTIYSMNVYTMYFSLFLAAAFGRSMTDFGWALTLANLMVALTSPLLGAMSDASQRRLPFLRFFAVGTALLTGLIALAPSFPAAVLLFTLSFICYNTAANFYQALLPGLCSEANVSRVSGIGVALGYVGSIAGLVAMMVLIDGPEQYRMVFVYTAVLFLLFALPCLTLVPDFAPPSRRVALDIGGAYRRVAETFANAKEYPGLFRFLLADFLYENAINAVIGFMAVYAKEVVGFSDGDLQGFFIFSTLFAVLFGFLFGPVVDRIGPKRSVLFTLGVWLVTFPLVTLASTPNQLRMIGPLAGVGLAAVWISSRTYLIALSPVARSGEFFGLYSLSGKSAGVVGVGVWTLVLSLLTDPLGKVLALKAAVWAMWLFVLVGALLVAGLPNVRPSQKNILQRQRPAAEG